MQSQTPQRLTFLPTTGDRVGWLTCDNSTEDAMSTTNLPLSGELAKQLEECCARPKKGDCRTAGRGRQAVFGRPLVAGAHGIWSGAGEGARDKHGRDRKSTRLNS